MNKRKFKKTLKNDMLVFGKAGIGRLTTVQLFFDEINQAPTETMNMLYSMSHPKVSHQRKRIPYIRIFKEK